MDREEKNKKNEEIKNLIKEKKELIIKELEELKKLENKYNKENESDLAILLFFDNITDPINIGEKDYNFNQKYQSIYYYADLNTIKIKVDYGFSKDVPNTVDLRDSFEDLKVSKFWPDNLSFNFINEINASAVIMKNVIAELLLENKFNSWNDVRTYIFKNKENVSKQIKEHINEYKEKNLKK